VEPHATAPTRGAWAQKFHNPAGRSNDDSVGVLGLIEGRVMCALRLRVSHRSDLVIYLMESRVCVCVCVHVWVGTGT
jgi:hypothetical protein